MKLFLLLITIGARLLYANATIHHTSALETIQAQQEMQTLLSAVEQGDPQALYYLATLYRDGNGLQLNFRKAFDLYHRSALKNFPPAQYQLGMMFRHGLGVKVNHELARYWLRKSARNRYPQAQDIFHAFYAP